MRLATIAIDFRSHTLEVAAGPHNPYRTVDRWTVREIKSSRHASHCHVLQADSRGDDRPTDDKPLKTGAKERVWKRRRPSKPRRFPGNDRFPASRAPPSHPQSRQICVAKTPRLADADQTGGLSQATRRLGGGVVSVTNRLRRHPRGPDAADHRGRKTDPPDPTEPRHHRACDDDAGRAAPDRPLPRPNTSPTPPARPRHG